MTPSIVNHLLAIFLVSILWSTTGCAKNEDEPTGTSSAAYAQSSTTTIPVRATHKAQTFESFLSEFSGLIKAGNWEELADITDFPLTIRGELDDEGSVEIDRKLFRKLIGGFFEEEIYLTINDELVSSTYRDLMAKPIDKPEIDGDTAELHGFHFEIKNQHWKLKQITTYVHVVEKFAQGDEK